MRPEEFHEPEAIYPEFKDEAVRQLTEKGQSVQEVADPLRVSSHSLHKWVKAIRSLSDRSIEDERLLALIRESYAASGGIYGSPRIFLDLREAGERIGRKRVARIMRTHRIRAIRGYKKPRNVVSHEPSWKLLGQYGCRVVLQQPEKGEHSKEGLPNAITREVRRLRIHRNVIQSNPAS